MAAENFGVEGFIIVAKQTQWNTPITDASVVRKVIFEPTSTTIKRMTEPRSTARLKGNRASTKNTQGMVWAEGDLEFFVHATQAGFWIEQMLQATSSSSANNPVEILPSTTSVTKGTPLTIASDKQPNKVLTKPLESGFLIFTFASIAGTTNTGKIEISGRDHNEFDVSEEIAVSGTGEALKAASSYSTGLADITSPKRASRLLFTFSSSASGAGSITVKGVDSFSGDTVEETITVSDPNTAVQSVGFFDSVSSVTVDTTSGGTLKIDTLPLVYASEYAYSDSLSVTISGEATFGNVGLQVDPVVYTHTLALSETLSEGLTIEVRKGRTTPVVYHGMLPTTTTITLAETVTMTLSMIGRDGRPRRNIAGTTTPTAVTGFTRPSVDVMPDWGMSIEINGQVYAISEATLTINHNIDWPEARFQGDVHYPKPVFKGERDFTFTASTDYTTGFDFDSIAYGVPLTAKIIMATKTFGGIYRALEMELPNAEFVGFPDPEMPDQTEILQTINLRAYTAGGAAGGAGGDEVKAKLYTTEASLS